MVEVTVEAPRRELTPAAFRDVRGGVDPGYLAAVRGAVAARDGGLLVALTGDLHEADLGDLVEALDPDERTRLIETLGADFDFTALTEVDDAVREDILDGLRPEVLAEGVRDIDSDDAVYILEDLDAEERRRVLDGLPVGDRAALARALDYPEGSAGRRMQTEFVAVPPTWTVGQTIDHLREADELPDQFYEVLVVDPAFRLVGHVGLDRVLRSKRPVRVADIMEDQRTRVRATDPQEEVARLFQRYDLVAAPVVDGADRLVGVLTFDDLADVTEEEADADLKALGGVKAEEEISDDVWFTVRSRFTWLFVNLLTALLASAVIGFYERSLEKMVALAVLMPVVSSMGGNAGTQTMTVAVRALATRDLGRGNALRIIRRELLVGAVNGLAFAVLLGAVAVGWFGIAGLGPVIGLAVIVTLVSAALGGIVIPLALERLGVDPAVASGPFVTTITDVVGFFSFLGIATAWFGFK